MLNWLTSFQETLSFLPLETFRLLILLIGWPVLIISSILLLYTARKIYIKLERAVYGKLIVSTTVGWVITSIAFGFISTKYMLFHVEAVPTVTIVFFLWMILIFVITWSVQKWDGEAIELNKLQRHLETLVIERTSELESVNHQLLEMDERIRIQNKDLRASKNLAEQQEKQIKTIIKGVGDGLFVVDAKGKIMVFNPMAEKLSGFSQEEALGKPYDKVLNFVIHKGEKQKKDNFLERALKTGKTTKMSANTVLVQKNGEVIAVADSAAPLKNEKGKVQGCVVVFRDESKHRRSDRMKTEFVSLVSHQLKTPLTAIRWGVESLEQSLGADLNVKQRIYLNDTKESTIRLIKLVNDLLNVSRIETGRLKIAPEQEDIQKLVKKSVDEMRPIAKAKNVKMTYKKSAKKIAKLPLDTALFFQVVHNLVSNAIRYTEPGGTIVVSVSSLKKGIVVSVKDTGIGIPENVKKKIFQKFFRAENAMKAATDGNGLGLYLAKMIMEVSGGALDYESKEREGTTFYIQVPKKGMKAKKGAKGVAI